MTACALLWSCLTGHPDAVVLARYADSARVPHVIAWALVAVESGHAANNRARGAHGEIGRLQVRRVHRGRFAHACGRKPLTDYRTNVCVGLFLLRSYYERTGSWESAIQRYNGRGPGAVRYLGKVQREIGRLTLRERTP